MRKRKFKQVWESVLCPEAGVLNAITVVRSSLNLHWPKTSGYFSMLWPGCFDSVGRFLGKCHKRFFVIAGALRNLLFSAVQERN